MSDSDDEGAARPEAVRRTIRKMMRDTGLHDSDAEGGVVEDGKGRAGGGTRA